MQHLPVRIGPSNISQKTTQWLCPTCQTRVRSFHRRNQQPRVSTLGFSQGRSFAVQSPARPALQVFNLNAKYLQKQRAALLNPASSRETDYLRNEIASRLCARLLDIKRRFPCVLDLGAGACHIARALATPIDDPEITSGPSVVLADKVDTLTAIERADGMLYRDAGDNFALNTTLELKREVLANEELLPYKANTFDAVMSGMSMHWINDLPSLLAQVNHVLKPDCPFIAAMLGGDSLFELRTSLQLAEMERKGGVSPRVSPLADVRDVGGLLQRVGFQMLTVDVDDIVVEYPTIFTLMKDLQAMGEGNAIVEREMGPLGKDLMLAAEGVYRELHGNEDGSLPATFRVIHMIAWKEGDAQAKPLPRGSGDLSMKDWLEGQANA